jgi:hypothetical protein
VRLLLADRADATLAQQHALVVGCGQSVPEPEPLLGAIFSILLAKFGIGLELLLPPFTSLALGCEYSFPILRIFGISIPLLVVAQ